MAFSSKQEDPGDDVLHQLLRAEADGDADDAGAGQQRADVDADLAERRQADDRQDGGEQRRAEDRRQRAQPGRARVARLARQTIETALQRVVDPFPHRCGDRHGDADGEQRRRQAAADRIAAKQPQGVETPGLEQSRQRRAADDGANDCAQRRSIAPRPPLQRDALGRQGAGSRQRAIEQAERGDLRQTADDQHRRGDDDQLQRTGEAVVQAQRPDQPRRDDDEDGEIVPDVGEPVAQRGEPAAGAFPDAQPLGDRGAPLHDDRHGAQRDRQGVDLDQAVAQPRVGAEQLRGFRQGAAEHGEEGEAPRPGHDVRRGRIVDVHQAQTAFARRDDRSSRPNDRAVQRVSLDQFESDQPRRLAVDQRRGDDQRADGGECGERRERQSEPRRGDRDSPRQAPIVAPTSGQRVLVGAAAFQCGARASQQPGEQPLGGERAGEGGGDASGRIERRGAGLVVGGEADQAAPQRRRIRQDAGGGENLL